MDAICLARKVHPGPSYTSTLMLITGIGNFKDDLLYFSFKQSFGELIIGHIFMPHKLIEKLRQLFQEEYIHNFLQIFLRVSQGIFVYRARHTF